jgi:hypothetical protein
MGSRKPLPPTINRKTLKSQNNNHPLQKDRFQIMEAVFS